MAKMYPCAVLGCKSADWENETTRHRLPHDDALRNAWLERIGVSAESKRNGDLRVCGRHFRAEDYHHNPRLLQELGCEQQAQLLSRVVGVDLDLAGDGRCDSPGHSAK
ncbi:hypothetical protein HPB49_013707 [Dermacentor silvarum]|uniref:Uncharacterized protein n=1 Tax=Dermacentor silvarum TaxID=543639 RepID=A0ACB8CXN9_DERSI|nr:hypothetical protein HPB49_013707 [Dermacentor silvarum]